MNRHLHLVTTRLRHPRRVGTLRPPDRMVGPATRRRLPHSAWHCRKRLIRRGLRAFWRDVIDYIPIFIVYCIGWLLLVGTRETACITDTSGIRPR